MYEVVTYNKLTELNGSQVDCLSSLEYELFILDNVIMDKMDEQHTLLEITRKCRICYSNPLISDIVKEIIFDIFKSSTELIDGYKEIARINRQRKIAFRRATIIANSVDMSTYDPEEGIPF